MGDIIRKEFEKSGWTVSQFAQKIRRDRTIVYHIFKRKIFDTDLLYDISMAFNTDLFQHYSFLLEQNNEMIRLKKEKTFSEKSAPKRKILIEVELSEEEYRYLVEKNSL